MRARKVLRTASVGAAVALGVAALTGTSAAPSQAVTSCRPTGTVLSRTPTSFALPGGADVRIWDTGHLSDPIAETRIVAVRVPKGSLVPKVLTAPTVDSVRTPQQLATPVTNAVVVVNGGVFDPVKLGIPTESQISGRGIRKGARTYDSSLAIWGPDNRLDVVTASMAGSVQLGASVYTLGAINWQRVVTNGLTVYTSAWGRTRHAAGPVALVLSGGRVVAKRTGSATTLPTLAGQIVVTAPTGTLATALSRVRVGWTAKLAAREIGKTVWDPYPHTTMSSPSGLLFAGGTLVRYGVNNITTCDAAGEEVRPRTVIGFLDNGDVLVVAISGRATVNGVRWGGATNHQAADYLVALGARIATKLDGGTSTTLLVRRTVGGPLLRLDRSASEYQRPTPDSLAFLAPA